MKIKQLFKKAAAMVMAAVTVLSGLPATTAFAATGDVGTISFTLHPEIPAEQHRNFRITDPELGHGTRSEKYAANVAAIRTLKQIEAEERLATPEEQEILSRYVGWGGLADCFDERHGKYLELKSLLSEDEYAAARASSLTAFYTSPVIIGAMYQALSQMGFRQGNILEIILPRLIQGIGKIKKCAFAV